MEESRTYSDRFLELKVLTLCFRSDKCFERKQQVNEDMFTSKDTKIMMKFLESFSDHFDDPEEWWEYLRVYAKPRMDEYEIEELEELFFSMWEDDEGNSDAVFESLLEQIRAYTYGRRVFAAVKDAVTHFKEGEPLKAKTTLEDAVLANANDGRIIQRGDFFEGLEQRIAKYKRGIDSGEQLLFPVGIRAIDEILPGIPKGSLCFYSGRTNIGKTFLLLETALQGCIANGFKVLVVSLELFMDVLEVRWDSRLTGEPIDSFLLRQHTDIQDWKDSVSELGEVYENGGRLAISVMPEGTTARAIESEVRRWEREWGSPVDIVVIDYGDLMDSERKSWSEQELQGNIFRDLKRLAQRLKCIVWTASQTSGANYKTGVQHIGDVGYSRKKAHWANLVFGISQGIVEGNKALLKLRNIKCTFCGGVGKNCYLSPDLSIAQIDTGEYTSMILEEDFDENGV